MEEGGEGVGGVGKGGGEGAGGGILDSRLHLQSCKTLSQCQSLQIFYSLLKFQDSLQCAMCNVQCALCNRAQQLSCNFLS